MLVKKALFSLVLVTFLISCSSPSTNQSWVEGMRGMSESLTQLFPYIYNSERYSNPDNAPIISNHLNRLNFSSDSLDKHIAVGLSGNDPLFEVGLKNLKRNFQTSLEAYNVESYEYSQEALKNSINYCVQCHMRTSIGRSYVLYDQFSNNMGKDIGPLEQARFFVANRKFSQAKELLKLELDSPENPILEKMDALKLSLLIHLRHENSIEQAKKLLTEQVKEKYPSKEKSLIAHWLKSLKKYKKVNDINLEKALIVSQMSEFTYVDAVLKSYILHQSLNSSVDKNKRAEIYYALGKIYSTHPSLGFWELPEQYYEACIYESPFTKISRKCYFQIEAKVMNTFKVSKGGALPLKETGGLKKLKALTIEKQLTPSGLGSGDRE